MANGALDDNFYMKPDDWADEWFTGQSQMDHASDVVARLTAERRMNRALIMLRETGATWREIAVLLHCGHETAKARYRRALEVENDDSV